jgi:AbrB family looped-hinge helix DNA binding protein
LGCEWSSREGYGRHFRLDEKVSQQVILSYKCLTSAGGADMQKTRLSSKGQVIIPKALRSSHHWEAGQELVAVDVEDGILLKPVSPFSESSLEEVANCLSYHGKAKTLKEMEEAISTGARKMRYDRG